MKAGSGLLACLLLMLFGSLIAAPGRAHACSCAAPPSVREELSRKTAVFSGTVTKVVKPDKQTIDSSKDLVEVTFDVEKVWKGELNKQTTVYTAIGEESCGYVHFKQGGKFIVSAYGTADRLETGMCELTKPVEQAGAAMDELGEGRQPENKTGSRLAEGFGPGWPWVALLAAVVIVASFVVLKSRKNKGGG